MKHWEDGVRVRVVPTEFPSNVTVLTASTREWEELLEQGWGVQVLNGMPLVPFLLSILTARSPWQVWVASIPFARQAQAWHRSPITAKEKLS